MNRIRNWLTPPVFEDEERNRVVRLLNVFLWATLVAIFLSMVVLWGFGIPPQDLIILVLVALIALAGLGLMQHGYLTLSALLVLLALAAFLSYLPLLGDGIHDTALVVYPGLIIAASLLLKPRLFIFYVVLLIVLVGVIAYSEIIANIIVTGYDKQDGMRDAIMVIIILVITAISVRTLTDVLVNSVARAHQSEHSLTQINAQLQAEIAQRRQAELTLLEAKTLLSRRNQELVLLNQVGQELNAALDTVQINERLLEAVVETVGAEGATIWLRETNPHNAPSDGQTENVGLVCRAVFRQDRDRSLLNLHLEPGQGIAGWVNQHATSLITEDVRQDGRFFAGADALTNFQTRSLLTVPIKVHSQVLGVLQVTNKLKGNFNSDDLIFAETLATSAAIAMQNAQLVEVLRWRTQQLEQQNQDLDAYAHTVAHDLKTPIARMVGFAEYLEQVHTEMSTHEREQYLQLVTKNGRKMLEIIDELLLLAGVRKALSIKRTVVKMETVVHAVLERLAGQIEILQAQIIVPDHWPAAEGYAPWLEEVWANYISNALKYGGRPPVVTLGAELLITGQVRFWVQDNGPGLKTAEMEHLFAPFTRLEQQHSRGHGLGLSIVHRIIEKLGGHVGVDSWNIAGQGCIFWFTLNSPASSIAGISE